MVIADSADLHLFLVSEASTSTIGGVVAILNAGELKCIRFLCWLSMMHIRKYGDRLLRLHGLCSRLICFIITSESTTRRIYNLIVVRHADSIKHVSVCTCVPNEFLNWLSLLLRLLYLLGDEPGRTIKAGNKVSVCLFTPGQSLL